MQTGRVSRPRAIGGRVLGTRTSLRLITAGAVLGTGVVLLTALHHRADSASAAVRPASHALGAAAAATAPNGSTAPAVTVAVLSTDLAAVAERPGGGALVAGSRTALAAYAGEADPVTRAARAADLRVQLGWLLGNLEARSGDAERDALLGSLLLLLTGGGVCGLLLRGAVADRREADRAAAAADRAALECELEHRAAHDDLTGLPHRATMLARLTDSLGDATSRPAVLVVDLARFREVNATLGAAYGDALLQHVGARLVDVAGADRVARLGGDEFAVLLPSAHVPGAGLALAAAVRGALAVPAVVGGVGVAVEVTIGIAHARVHAGHEAATAAETMLREADIALHLAKASATGVATYDRSADTHSRARLGLLTDLRRVCEGTDAATVGSLVLHHQPQVDLATGRVVGVEALVRWQHPTRGLLAPAEFVPAAERSALITPMTMTALDLALTQAAAWRAAGHPLRVSVNLSPRCLHDPELPGQVAARLEQHRVPADLLCLEVTESSLMSDPARGLATLAALRALGIRLSVDDFGTGWSSLAALRALPVDELKVDRSFLAGPGATGAAGEVLLRTVVSLGHDLGLTVVAEGIEDEATLDRLRALGCDQGQGFLLGRPVPGAELDARLRAERHAGVLVLPDTAHLLAVPGLVPAPRVDRTSQRAR